ncbi:MAG: hypothetical protein DRI90_23395 [Deltaproteobacteria bacterium]|nr:MAG: hypothetical protein DRI90_23395 [Deltaproteobacteria bacterium]
MAPTTALATPTGTLTPAQYRRLVADLRKLLDRGRRRAELAVAHHLVETYHAMGERLLRRKLTENAGYRVATVRRVADEIGIGHHLLHRAVALARAYPEGPPESGLRWSHYRELLTVVDPGARSLYEAAASEEGWSSTKLVQAIRGERFSGGAASGGKVGRGRKTGKVLQRPSHPLHVYKARVLRVVDGDTLLADVDLGFQVHKEQRLRLAGIDTPPLGEDAGAEAHQVVLELLAAVEFVVLWTVKIDLYGRYVAHVFYQPGESDKRLVALEGKYLNQELVDRGVAQVL